jgi:hypothetical protein
VVICTVKTVFGTATTVNINGFVVALTCKHCLVDDAVEFLPQGFDEIAVRFGTRSLVSPYYNFATVTPLEKSLSIAINSVRDGAVQYDLIFNKCWDDDEPGSKQLATVGRKVGRTTGMTHKV